MKEYIDLITDMISKQMNNINRNVITEKGLKIRIKEKEILQILKEELASALGCTEPVAIAYAAAKARAVLGRMPECASIGVSRNILKNAMGVGIPGTDIVGREMAAALGNRGMADTDQVILDMMVCR